MIQVTFETATLADAITKAARHAPKKGSAVDRSAGIVLEVDVAARKCVVRSTDLAIFYRQELGIVNLKGDADISEVSWRVSSVFFEALVTRLPMHMGATVTLAEKGDDGMLWLQAGGVKARLNIIDRGINFPLWDAFDPEGMTVVENLAERLGQVGWAVDTKSSGVLGGVYLDGHHIFATDRNVAARVPLECELDRPVCAPLQEIEQLVKNHPELHVRIAGNFLEVMPDPDTQLRVGLLEGDYPAIGPFLEQEMPIQVELDREPLLAAIDRLLVITQGERYPLLKVEFRGSTLRLTIEAEEVGRISEDIDLGHEAEPFTFFCTPGYLRPMLKASKNARVSYERYDDPLKNFRLSDGHGFLSVTAPRRVTEKA